MSRLTDLMRQLHAKDPQLGADLESEIRALTKRRNFGLVFERHQPEAVELPGISPKRGSKVRILEPRGSTARGDKRLWLVERLTQVDGVKIAHLTELNTEEPEQQDVAVDDLVVVAEFKDGIFPGIVETGRVEHGGDKPFHTVINAENFHALEMLTYTHRGKIDAIYIDPPYNTGAKDWKYNNDYVEGDDAYRHSKWLAMMERRLLVAKELLNPDDSVLIVTIDEKEYLRLGMLLEQTFPEARSQMISAMTNKKGSTRPGRFSRSDEYIYILQFGMSSISASDDNMMLPPEREDEQRSSNSITIWNSLLRRGTDALRSDRPNMFYPIFVDPKSGRIVGVGEALPLEADRQTWPTPPGVPADAIASWPLRKNGIEGRWQVGPDTLRERIAEGRARAGQINRDYGWPTIVMVKDKQMQQIEDGVLTVTGRDAAGALLITQNLMSKHGASQTPRTIWVRDAHDASVYGSTLLSNVIPGRKFPFPKSLYAVEDTLRFFVKTKPDAVILDFFSGSGTTAHAVMRLNRQDGGRRQCISITNNEVSADEQKKLRKQGLRPGDPEWEALGICDYITKPRVTAAITGRTPDGQPIKGDYKFTDEFPMADGFEENSAFFTLTYESPLSVRHGRAFERVAPMLWLKAGSQGRIITSLGKRGWNVSEVYGVLEDFNNAAEFFDALAEATGVRMVCFVTDDDAVFQMACRKLPEGVEPVRLYSSYLQNFEINRGRA